MRKALSSVLVLAVLPALPVGAQQFSILYHETLANPAFTSSAGSSSVKPQPIRLSFQAFGRQFDVALERNQGLLVGRTDAVEIELYRGEISGLPDSWARISRHGDDVSGIIFDGAELYVLEPFRSVAKLLATPSAGDGATIVYRWGDTVGPLADAVRSRAPTEEGQAPGAALLEHITAAAVISPPQQIDVGFIGDFEFWEHHQAFSSSHLLSIANIVDGIFGEQTGVFIAVPQVQVFEAAEDPFSSSDPPALLAELEDHKFQSPELQPLGLAHLFTRRDLEESEGQIVGIANIGALCQPRFGVGLTQATFGLGGDALVAAHEIAHNFGAPHDTEAGSPCSGAPPGHIMEPTLSFSETFSQCSLDHMAAQIAAAPCLRDLASNDASVRFGRLPTTVWTNVDFDVDVIVESSAANDARRVSLIVTSPDLQVVDVDAPHDWSCTTAPAVECTIDPLPPLRSDMVTLTMRSGASTADFRIELAAANDPDMTNNVLDHVFVISSKADLTVDIDPQRVTSRLGLEHIITGTVHNIGSEPATEVNAEIVASAFSYQLLELTPSAGACEQGPDAWIYNCALGTLAGGEAQTITMRVKTLDTLSGDALYEIDDVSIELTANEVPTSDSAVALIISAAAITDIETSVTGPVTIESGVAARYIATYTNNGPDAATDLVVHFGSPEFELSIESLSGSPATCNTDVLGITCQAAMLPAGQGFVLTAAAQAISTGTFYLESSTFRREWDRDDSNNTATVDVQVAQAPAPPDPDPPPSSSPPPTPPPTAPPPQSASGGGGGAGGPVLLVWLLAVLAFQASLSRPANRDRHLGRTRRASFR